MESKNYYDILGVSVEASLAEITAAKNTLAKQFHPDVNLKRGIDTTIQMQEILEAYHILSDPALRSEYDKETSGRTAVIKTYDLHDIDDAKGEPSLTFVTYWKASNALYDIILKSDALFRKRDKTGQLSHLAAQALRHILTLRGAEIPERYWHPDIMNWLLFTSYKNRNYMVAYLLILYDEHIKKHCSKLDKIKLKSQSLHYQHSVKKLLKY